MKKHDDNSVFLQHMQTSNMNMCNSFMFICRLKSDDVICYKKSYFSPVDCTSKCFCHLFSPGPWWMLQLLQWCTYSSFPRKDVSLHATVLIRISEETLTEDVFGRWSSKGLQPLGAVTGVKTWSELTDVRSVLRSNDVQEESEEAEGLVSTFSSCNLSLRSMVQGWKCGERNENEWRRFGWRRLKRWMDPRMSWQSRYLEWIKRWRGRRKHFLMR